MSIVALILFFVGGDLQGAQVIGLADSVEHCHRGLNEVLADPQVHLKAGVVAVPMCVEAKPGEVHPRGDQTKL